MALPVNLQSTDPGMRLEMIRMAVIKIMDMNSSLYNHLHSDTFDVPDYEKENIIYNNETLNIQLAEYMSGGYFHTDFRFHQKLLDVQIICNRRIRQNVRECREMYADRHNPLYSRRKYKTIKIFPDAVKRNLPELLPMTHLCDHLLTICHYMHDPVVSLVMDYITDGGTRPSVVPGVHASQSNRSSTVFPGSFHAQMSCVIHQETRANTASVEISRTTATPASTRHVRALEFPGHVLPVDIPQPVNLYQKNRHDTNKPVNLLEKSRHPVPASVNKLEKTKPVEKPKPVKPVEKPKMICASDMVGQILLQGLNTSETKFMSLLSHAKQEKTLTKPSNSSEVREPVSTSSNKIAHALKGPMTDGISSRPSASKSATKHTVSTSKVTWDVSKVLTQKPALSKTTKQQAVSKNAPKSVLSQAATTALVQKSVSKKRSNDNLADDVRDEMTAKRQRLSQWLHEHATQPVKKVSSGTKRKASLMDKSCKDHSAKKQKMTEAKPSTALPKPTKKPDVKWIK